MTTSAPRRPRQDAVDNRAGILSAATAAIAHDPQASINTIARSAGLSRRALYGHFADRNALLAEIIDAGAERFNRIASDVTDTDAQVALARLTSLLWQQAAHVQVAASIALDDAHLEATGKALAPLRHAVAAILQRGQNDGTLRTDVDVTTLARLVEEAARAAITRVDATLPEARSLAVRTTLSMAGLSWRETVALLEAHPDILGAPAAGDVATNGTAPATADATPATADTATAGAKR
ncbi:TetR/AcrR family transcriptional regulator [Salinibacterium sp. NG253]|uniref:TetR/AcrR family transcriptional regulator n=1 Tax=Salinibacterium sp. NG253 TaxID=2792039 RepID=UPI0018CD39CA|nr:TetR/AcrR family transcriptional regulator [Salinibacterium sp. NG253]MBH0117040.1 TetR/AcrR family transcriptional regulator [Salinibacterium sp. NG253]